MGYTHYWTRPSTIETHIMEQIAGDFLKATVGINEDIPVAFAANRNTLNINGIMNSKCEDFLFPRKANDISKNGFCKTNRLPYDIFVCCALLIVKRHLKTRIHVSTDGDQDDWQQAMNTCSHILGYEYKKFDITDNGKLRYRFWE